ncbi:Nn.00g102840.m01.CDS01 [Neocucurbitaria sp. VM-36]
MPVGLKIRTFARPIVQQSRIFPSTSTSLRMASSNEYGQGKSHATGESAVPNKVQDVAPKGLEDALPEGVHPTGSNPNDQSTNQTHAKDGGDASIVPKKIQEKLPESVERAVPNAIHDTGDK